MSVILRPYQNDLVAKIREAFGTHRRVLAVAPTGSGKTAVLGEITKLATAKGKRVLIVAHRRELIAQLSIALNRLNIRHGRIQPTYRSTDDLAQCGMVQTIARRLGKLIKPALIIFDESHHATAGDWAKVLAYWPDVPVMGVTATPERLDGKPLGDVFGTMVSGPTVRWLIDNGFLAGFSLFVPPTDVDLSSVRTTNGDYNADDLVAAYAKSTITDDAVRTYTKYLAPRPAIAFCATVAHAEEVALSFREAGFRAASIDGKMEAGERANLLASLGDGRLNVLTSCALINEGVDVPAVAGAILLRATKSLAVYLQQVGRVLRVKPDGSRAIILDHVGNAKMHGPPDRVHAWSLDGKVKRNEIETRSCPACYQVFEVQPGWRAQNECMGAPADPSMCIFSAADASEKEGSEGPEKIDAELVEYVEPVSPAWCGGLSIFSGDLKSLMRAAKTEAHVEELGRARKYHPRWATRMNSLRAERKREAPWPTQTRGKAA